MEATAQMNKTPDTMNIDLGQIFLEKSLLIFSEAKAGRVNTRLDGKKMPKSSHTHTPTYKIASNWKKWSFPSSFLIQKKYL